MTHLTVCRLFLCIQLLGCFFLNAYATDDTIEAIVNQDVLTVSEHRAWDLIEQQNHTLNYWIDQKLLSEAAEAYQPTDHELNLWVKHVSHAQNMTTSEWMASATKDIPWPYYQSWLRSLVAIERWSTMMCRDHHAPDAWFARYRWYHPETKFLIKDQLIAYPDWSQQRVQQCVHHTTACNITTQWLKWVPMHALPSVFVAQIQTLAPHQTSPPIHTGNGWHVITWVDQTLSIPNIKTWHEQVQQYVRLKSCKDMWLAQHRQQALLTVHHE
jgi:hypothetical protein